METKADVERKGESAQSFGEKKARLSKAEWVKLKGDFELRRSGWGSAENKAACFECGNTDQFKAHCPIWV